MPPKRAPPELAPRLAAAARGGGRDPGVPGAEPDGSDSDLVEFEPGKYRDRDGVVYQDHYCGPPELRDAFDALEAMEEHSWRPPADGPRGLTRWMVPLVDPPPPPPPDWGLADEARPGQLRACAAARAAVDNLMRELGVAPVPAPSSGWILMRDPKR